MRVLEGKSRIFRNRNWKDFYFAEGRYKREAYKGRRSGS